jgi:hypothetical protein
MAYTTKKTESLLAAGQIVENHPTNPSMVQPHTTGTPTGIVLEGETVYDGIDNPVAIGFSARVVYGGGDKSVPVPTPSGYTGEISRFNVTTGGVVAPVATGGYGYLVGVSPTWLTWGG